MPAATRKADPPRRADVARNAKRIVEVATEVLADRPDASMQEIAEAAQLSRVTLYRHFANREQLITEIQRAGLAESRAMLERLPARGEVVPPICEALAEGIALGARYRVVALSPRTDQGLFIDEATTAMPLLRAIARGKRRGEIGRELNDMFIVTLFAYLTLGAIGLIERTAADRDRVIADAQTAFRKAVTP